MVTTTDPTYVLKATSLCGTVVHTGPMTAGEALRVAEQHLTSADWAHQLLQITPLDRALNVFDVHTDRGPVAAVETHLFGELRTAITDDPDNDPDDPRCARTAAMVMHVSAHRPVWLYRGDEECLLAECDHERVDGGRCAGLEPAGALCQGCSLTYDGGSEWDPRVGRRVPGGVAV